MCSAVCFVPAAPAAEAANDVQPVALVTEVSGESELLREGGGTALRLLAELALNARVQLKKDAHATLLYLQTGDQFVLAGPGSFTLRADQPANEKASGGIRKLGPVTGKDGKVLQVRKANLSQAGMTMRTTGKRPIPLKGPKGPVVLGTSIQFEWEAIGENVEYDFLLKDTDGNTVFSRVVSDTSLALPPGIQLDAGAAYRWSVAARTADGSRYLSVQPIRMAGADIAAESANFRPGDVATVAERMAYVAWLEGNGLNDEARKYWEDLSKRYSLSKPRN